MFGIDDAVAAVFSVGGKLIDKLIPDPAAAAQAKLDLMKMQQTGELAQLTADTDVIKAQLAINQAEASNTNIFVSGGRPAAIWVSVASLAFAGLVAPLGTWVTALMGHPTPFPAMDSNMMWLTLSSLLGIGGLRTYEKTVGVKSAEPSDAVGVSTRVGG